MRQKALMVLFLLALSLPPCVLVFVSAAPTSQPTSQPAVTQLTGTLTTNDTVTRIAAVDRPWANVLKTSEENPKDKFLYEGTYDEKTKSFTIKNLLPTRSYDLIIWTENAAKEKTRWEGVTMDYHREILPADVAADDDKKWLENFVKETPAFFDTCRILHLAADHKHATALVELKRTRDFHAQKNGEIIYRVELWYFENQFGGWAKDKNTEKVLARVRTPKLPKNWQFLPALGNLSPSEKPLAITLPEKPTDQIGLAERK
jgi:hypothetical protein